MRNVDVRPLPLDPHTGERGAAEHVTSTAPPAADPIEAQSLSPYGPRALARRLQWRAVFAGALDTTDTTDPPLIQ